MTINWDSLRGNQLVPIRELLQLEQSLKKADSIGYQTAAQADSGAHISPLVTQSIEDTLFSATYGNEEIRVWPGVPKKSATNTVHEFNRLKSHGEDVDPFFAEGGVPVTTRAEIERDFVKIKYMAVRREITDVATTVGLTGPDATALAHETTEGTIQLMGRMEKALFYANDASNPLAFKGIVQQIEAGAPDNVHDLAGSQITPQMLVAYLSWLYEAPRFGVVNCICVEPRIFSALIEAAIAYGRHDQFNVSENSGITFGVRKLEIMAPYGPVEVRSVPLLHNSNTPNTAQVGSGTSVPGSVAFATQPIHDAGAVGTSKWAAADAGDYIYKLVAVSPNGGLSAPSAATTSVTVAAGQKIKIEMTLNSLGESNTNPDLVTAYRVFRSAKNGAADTCRLIATIPINTLGTAKTRFVDLNADQYDTGTILFMKENDPRSLFFAQLLPFLRRPLHSLVTTIPFLLMLFGAPVVPTPTKLLVLKNVGKPSLTLP